MLRIKREWWVIAVIFFTLFLPSVGYSLERDPYLRRNLIGSITFEYERYRSENSNGTKSEANTFHQLYTLDVKGNMFSRAIMIYDLGVSWDSSYFTTDASNFTTSSLTYYGRTTLLPLSRIPFTVYANRKENKLSGTTDSETNTTTYGFSWLIDFLALPTTRMSLERRTVDGNTQNLKQLFGTLNLKKEVGPSETEVDYKYINTVNSESTDPETAEITDHTINARSSVDLSRSTSFGAALTYNTELHPLDEDENEKLIGISLGLDSRPGSDFAQNHNYSFYKTERGVDDGSRGHTYSGSMNYDISSRLTTSLSLAASDVKNESDPTDFKSKTLATHARLMYRITENLRFTETVSYINVETNAEDDTGINVGKRKTLRVLSSLDYNRKLDWATANAGYSIGYTEDEAEEGSGTGIEQQVNGGLYGIDVNPMVVFSLYGNYYYLESLSGPIWERRHSYNAEAYNKVGREYAEVTAKYSKESEGGWLEEITNRNVEKYGISAKSNYFENTTFGASAYQTNTTKELLGTSQVTLLNASASHRRTLLGGRLTLIYGYSLKIADSEETSDRTTMVRYLGEYQRRLRFNLSWKFRATREEEKITDTTDSFSNITTLSNSFQYRLRAWRITLEHDYDIIETNSVERTDNTLFLRATRRFLRFF